jgi:threonine dehydratase
VAGGIDQDTITLPLARTVVDCAIECDESEIVVALKTLAFDENMIVEGSAALALAVFTKVDEDLSGQTSVILLCGANFDQGAMTKVLYGV